MPAIGPTQIGLALLSFVLLLVFWAMIVAWGWLVWRILRGQPILPERPLVERDLAPWRAGTVLVVGIAYMLVIAVVVRGYPLITDLLPAEPVLPVVTGVAESSDQVLIGASPLLATRGTTWGLADPAAGGASEDNKKMPLSHQLLLNGVIDLLMLLVIPVVARFTCGARLRDFGISFDGWWRQAAVGVIATLIATPPVSAIQFLAAKIWSPQAHPLQEMMFKEFTFGIAGLAVMTAVVVAPLFEEIAFRGFLQTWLVGALYRSARRSASEPVVVEISLDAPATPGHPTSERLDERVQDPAGPYEPPKALDIGQPAELSAVTAPATHAWLGIILTSLVFASVHYAQWPAPIALCALALVIGTVYYRTGSLIAAVVMHASFNGLNTLLLFLVLLSGQKPKLDKLTIYETSDQPTVVKMEKTENVVVTGGTCGPQKAKTNVFFLDEPTTDCYSSRGVVPSFGKVTAKSVAGALPIW